MTKLTEHYGPKPHRGSHAGLQLRLRIRPVRGTTPRNVLAQPLHFPAVIGDTFEVTEDAGIEDFMTIGAGEFSAPTGGGKHAPHLKSFTHDGLTMTWSPKWMTHPHQDPEHVRRVLYAILHSRKPVHVLALLGPGYDASPEFNDLATLRNISRRLNHGEADTRYYTLDWRQWRDARAPRRRHKPHGGHHLPTKHKLDANDTLRSLAHHYYGKGSKWRLIAKANGIKKWGSEDALVKMKRFKVGDKVRIPDDDGDHGHRHHHHDDDPNSGGVGTG